MSDFFAGFHCPDVGGTSDCGQEAQRVCKNQSNFQIISYYDTVTTVSKKFHGAVFFRTCPIHGCVALFRKNKISWLRLCV